MDRSLQLSEACGDAQEMFVYKDTAASYQPLSQPIQSEPPLFRKLLLQLVGVLFFEMFLKQALYLVIFDLHQYCKVRQVITAAVSPAAGIVDNSATFF